MLRVSYIIPSKGLQRLGDLPLSAFSDAVITTETDKPNELEITLNSQAQDYLELFRDNKDIGIRVTTQYFDYAFIKQDGGKEAQIENNILSLNFTSYFQKLNNVENGRTFPWGQKFLDRSLNLILLELSDNDIIFESLSPDLDISFDTGFLTDYELINEIVKKNAVGYNYIDKGIENRGGAEYNIIQIANYDDLPPNRWASNTLAFQSLDVDDIIHISSLERRYSGEQLKGILPIGTTSNDSNTSASIFITNPAAVSPIDGYVLEPHPTLTDRNNQVYYVRAVGVSSGRVAPEPFDLFGNVQTNGIVAFNELNSSNLLHQLAVQKLKSKQDRIVNNFSISSLKPVIAGDRVQYNYNEKIEYEGNNIISLHITDKQTVRKAKLNLFDYA